MEHTFTDPLVDIENVFFQYPNADVTDPHNNHKNKNSINNNKTSLEVPNGIYNINLRAHKNDRILVVGHNGSGKSTLLSIIAGRRKCSTGRTFVLGSDAFDNTKLQQYVSLIGNPWPPEAFFSSTVNEIASPAPNEERRKFIAEALHLSLQRSVGKMSSGEKRRVQILHGMLNESIIYLLDECSTDIDIAERRTVLELVKKECELNKGCCFYATHILDGINDWATHILLMQNGQIIDFKKITDIKEPLEEFTHKFLARHHTLTFNSLLFNFFKDEQEEEKKYNNNLYQNKNEKETVIICKDLNYKNIFSDLSFNVYRGERMLLCGCNGAGKSTLLNMMGGKQFFNNRNGALQILGKVCYNDMKLNSLISFGGDWWSSTPTGEVYVKEIIQINTRRGHFLQKLLDVDLNWDVRRISAGEQKRVQLLLHLLEDKPIVLLDEATSDLDLDQRHALLSFLYAESIHRGVTVIYATHIFGGLEGWPSAVLLLNSTTHNVHALWREGEFNLTQLTEEIIHLKSKETIKIAV